MTRETVTIAVPSAVQITKTLKLLETFFNTHFEFYGRHLELVRFSDTFTGAAEATQQNMDKEVAKVKATNPFASTSFNDVPNTYYYDQLADAEILSTLSYPWAGESHLSERHPYQWSYLPDWDTVQLHWGKWICKQFGDGEANYAGPGVQGQPRKFGYYVHVYREFSPSTAILDRELEACEAKPERRVERLYRESFALPTAETMAEATARLQALKSEDVTSIICICHIAPLRRTEMQAATNLGFFPEWITNSFVGNDYDAFLGSGPQEQMANAFSLYFHSKAVPTPDLPLTWALKAVDPSYEWATNKECFGGPDYCAHSYSFGVYNELLLLASGIQMAGPNLTPASFARGLQEATFPNPPGPYPAYNAAQVGSGLNAGRHAMVDDVTVVWWGPDQQSNWGNAQGPGAWCFSQRGRRYLLEEWASIGAPPLRQGPCY